jgi:hypothetical protein
VLSYTQSSPEHIESLVLGFLAGDPEARESLPSDLGERLRKIAGEIAPDLKARGLTEDIVQELFRLLLTRPAGHYNPDRAGPWAYLRTMLLLAVRDVRAKEAPAGAPRRPKRNEGGESGGVLPPLSLQDALIPDDKIEYFEDLVLSEIVTVAFIDAVPAEAPAWLGRALSLVVEGLTITETAAAVGVSRFVLRRALNRWAVPQASVLR